MSPIDALDLQMSLLADAAKQNDSAAVVEHEHAFLLGMIFMARRCCQLDEEAAEQ